MCENPCKNIVENLCMCGFILTHRLYARNLRKNLYETIPCILYPSVCKAKIILAYSSLTHVALLCACFLFLAALPMAAREADAQDAGNSPSWYIGIQGGVPFGVSTFSSFGADKTRAGYNLGLYGGYRFNAVWSLEAQTAWGRVNQSAESCCAGYWLGADGYRYEAVVAGMDGWRYADLKSGTFTQRYGLQLNVNLLGFFPKTRHGRWSLELSPHIAAIGTESDFRLTDGKAEVMQGDARWHFGAGGNVQASYTFPVGLQLGIYTGMTYLTGKQWTARRNTCTRRTTSGKLD